MSGAELKSNLIHAGRCRASKLKKQVNWQKEFWLLTALLVVLAENDIENVWYIGRHCHHAQKLKQRL